MIQILHAKKNYGGTPVLDIVHFELPGGLYWLTGRNGTGKTTLLRMIAGLIPFQGNILVDGLSLRAEPVSYRKKVSWAEAEPIYPSFVSGRELVRFYQDIRKAPYSQVDKLVSYFGMEQSLSDRVGSYSSGMLKRLSLILAFLGSASLVLLDEPLATLDADAAVLLPSLIRDYRQNSGTSFIFSSHQPFPTTALPVDKRLAIAGGTLQPLE